MKIELTNYTFAPGGAGAGTITLNDYTIIDQKKILIVINSTRGLVIYNPANSTLNGTTATNVLTLTGDTTGHNAADNLIIYYEDATGLGGITKTITSSITRPANSTAYATGQVVGTAITGIITIANAARLKAGSGVVIGLTLLDEANQTTKGDFDIFLFDTAPAAQVDQAAFAPSNSEMEACLGVIQFTGTGARIANAGAGAAGNVIYPSNMTNYTTFVCGAGAKDIYAVIVARSAYIPVSGEKFTIRSRVQQD
jgi:hypothetical protein